MAADGAGPMPRAGRAGKVGLRPIIPPSPIGAAWRQFWRVPAIERAYILAVIVAALALPFVVHGPVHASRPAWMTALALVIVSVLNVEFSRILAGGLSRTQQPHKALSAWAFATALLLPSPWLLLIVVVTYLHAGWRGLRIPLWKWVGSAGFLVLSGLAAVAVRAAVVGTQANWMAGDGGRGLVGVVAAAGAFLATETVLFTGTALLNDAADEVWLRATLRTWSFYGTEAAVLLIGGLLAAVWTGGAWFSLLLVPIYGLAQRAALHEPLRERAAAAARLAEKNDELELANQFKIDVIGMLGHEIGNPMTAIQGYAEVGADSLDGLAGDEVEVARNALAVVERNALQIRAVLHDILTMVSSDRGALTAVPQPCRLAPRLHAAVASVPEESRPPIACAETLTAVVQPGHLDQILANLVNNAEKYAGGATGLSASATSDGLVQIIVEDAGPGVHGAFREHLFQRFARDADTAQRVMGTGLGLFITRELARANGGDVGYRDVEPTGSAFVVTLPEASQTA
ncbi:sensor histidine kinase [Nocardioides terrisoli]|uniref:sensor histidine kinase n=1 Tax=Nocardioides terrisoli TaxID=3388267 RepID=UPI00287B7B25|nr:HAMP domain-containing sensor histidine kinase [Nocardioides marmorisolisilvae]